MNRTNNSPVDRGLRKKVDRSSFYWFLQLVARPFLSLYFRYESYNSDNIPRQCGAVVATNHASNLDPPLVAVDLKRPLFAMAKESLHETPLLGTVIRKLNSFPVRRGTFDRSALRTAINLLENDNLLLMFPEGTRTINGSLQEARPGVGKIVAEASVPVVPGYIKGSYEALPKGTWFPRPVKTSVHFGEPMTLEHLVTQPMERSDYERLSDEILDEIRELKERVELSNQEGLSHDG